MEVTATAATEGDSVGRKRKADDEESSEETSQQATSSSNEQNVSQRYLNGKWVFRYETGVLATFDETTSGWTPVPEDDIEFLQQLWFEQEEEERKQAAAGAQPSTQEIDDDFLLNYHANYGVQYDYSKMEKPAAPKEPAVEEKKEEKPKGPRAPGWKDMDESVFAVYVSNLPFEITDKEFHDVMAKCGVIQLDARTNKPKLKLYKGEYGDNKGDGRCCYVKKESVELALNILDGMQVGGKAIKVERAHFELKGDYDPKKKRKKLTASQRKRFAENQNKHFEWRPDKPRNYRPLSDCTVVIKNLFTVKELNEDASRLFDLKEELQQSCEKFGTVKKVHIYDNNVEGVASVSFDTTMASDEAVKMLNGRLVRGRQLVAHLWDGKTKYNKEETEEEKKIRLDQWNKYIEGEEAKKKEEEDKGKEKEEEKEKDSEGAGSSLLE